MGSGSIGTAGRMAASWSRVAASPALARLFGQEPNDVTSGVTGDLYRRTGARYPIRDGDRLLGALGFGGGAW